MQIKIFLRIALIFMGTLLGAESSLFTLSILPLGRDVILEVNEDLNLTCRVITRYRTKTRYELSWELPTRLNGPFKDRNADRITVYQKSDQLTITIHGVREEDTGIYVCKMLENGITWTQSISVFVRSRKCNNPFFDCGGGLCISKHFVCDGYMDCPTGFDEAPQICGQDACTGKILCEGRCISKKLCCDPTQEQNCTANYLMPCCPAFQYNGMEAADKPPPCRPSEDCHYLGNSVLYIVATCAGVVMLVSTVIMFLAFRMCTRHAGARRTSRETQRQYLQGVATLTNSETPGNMDFLFEEVNSPQGAQSGSEANEDFVLVNFIPGLGYEIAECGPKPPPYTQNVVGIPPPPYQSTVDLSESNKDDAVPNQSSNL